MLDKENISDQERESVFSSLVEESLRQMIRLKHGQKVKAKVVNISGDSVYVDIGGKSEGIINVNEFINEDGTIGIKEGEEIDAFFVSVKEGLKQLTTLFKGYPLMKLKAIQSAFESGNPIKGEVKGIVKGGFIVSLEGINAFCPASQIDIKKEDGENYLGQTFYFKVLDFKEDGSNVVVSRRVLLEEERQKRIDELRSSLHIGMNLKAKILSIKNFGIFVDLGGIEGFIPASEISWEKIDNIEAFYSVGQEVTAKIISMNWEKNQVTLSIKATQPDPWTGIEDKYPIGSRVSGTIVRLEPYGAFLSIDYGIEGLIHISNIVSGRRIKHPKEVLEVGQRIEAYILSIDKDSRKLSLSMKPKVEPKDIVFPDVGDYLEGIVEKVMPFGVFVRISDDLNGLIPNSEMGTLPNSDHIRMFPPGSKISVVVSEVDKAKGRVTLSRKRALERLEMDELKEYRESIQNSSELSTLGQLLKAKIEEKKAIF